MRMGKGRPGPEPGRAQDSEKSRTGSWTLYRRLLGYLRGYHWLILIGLPTLCVASFIGPLPFRMLGGVIDAAMGKSTAARIPFLSGILTGEPVSDIVRLAAAYVVLVVTTSVLNGTGEYVLSRVGQRIIYDFRTQLHAHLQRLSLRYYEGQRTGEIVSRVMGDVDAVENSILGPITGLLTDFAGLGGVLTFSFAMDWRLTLIALTVAPTTGVLTYFIGKKIRTTFRIVREKAADLTATLHDGVSGIRVIRGFAREPEQQAKFNHDAEESFRWNMKIALIFAAMRPAIRTIVSVTTAFVVGYGGFMLWRSQGQANPVLTAGMLTTFLFFIRMIFRPILGVGRTYAMIQRAMGAVERVFEVLDTKVEIEDAPDAEDLPETQGNVTLENVRFAYGENAFTLQDISLQARSGEMIALVGPSGAGKTTLVNLIPRFYDVDGGRVLVDGRDVRTIKQRSLRKHIGMVLQETFLFNDSVRNNIAFGKPDATDEEIKEAARAANAHEFIMALPQGYDTEVGERGVKLSGGEKQRLAIARAILSDPRILILDEATSSVDTETESLIQKAIERLVKDRTTFCIAHRLSTVHRADEIVVMNEGRIVERGTHAQLVDQGGLYKKLYERQFAAALERVVEEEPQLSAASTHREEPDAIGLGEIDDIVA